MSDSEIFGSEIADILNCNPHNLPRFTDVPSKFKVAIFDFFASSSIFCTFPLELILIKQQV